MTTVSAPRATAVERPTYRWAWIGAGASVLLLVALFTFLTDHAERRLNSPRDFGSRAVWFLWAAGDPPVVATEPGSAALPGTWTRYEIGRGGFVGLRGRPLPREVGETAAPQDGSGRLWTGGLTGETREIGDVTWREYARWGGLTDLDELGRDSEFVGRWRAGVAGLPDDVELASDGTIRGDSAARPLGRWAGRGRLLVIRRIDWIGGSVRRFVRDPSDPSGDHFVLDEGCEIFDARRIR